MFVWQRWWLKKQGHYDTRLMPARKDLADEKVRDLVAADAYISAQQYRVTQAAICVHGRADPKASRETTFLYGEQLRLLDLDPSGWAWVQSAHDGYVGYVLADAIAPTKEQTNYRVIARDTHLYQAPSVKALTYQNVPFHGFLALDAAGEENGFIPLLDGSGWVPARHVWPKDKPMDDHPVTLARRLIGAPYLWGGKASTGLDCSALIQLVCWSLNIDCPRDSDQQRNFLGQDITKAFQAGEALQAGDLVYFPGHVGMMTSKTDIIHANAGHMGVAEEPLVDVLKRGEKGQELPILAVKRVAYPHKAVKPTFRKTVGPYPV